MSKDSVITCEPSRKAVHRSRTLDRSLQLAEDSFHDKKAELFELLAGPESGRNFFLSESHDAFLTPPTFRKLVHYPTMFPTYSTDDETFDAFIWDTH